MKPKSIFLLVLLCFCLVQFTAQAQFNFFKTGTKTRSKTGFIPYSSVGIGGGHANYYGELGNYSSVSGFSGMIRWNASADYTRYFSRRFSARLGFSYARLFGDDNSFGNKNLLLNTRNLHFRNDVKEFSLTGMLNLLDGGKDFKRRGNGFRPYIFGGIALFAHDPKAKASEAFGGDWERLQPLATEGQGLPGYGTQPYSLVQIAIPYGFGIKFKVSERLELSAELGFRATFTDYLDDVGGDLPDPADLPSDLSRAMSNRSLEPVGAYSGQDRKPLVVQYLNNQFGFPLNADPFAQPIATYSERGDTRGTPAKKDSYLLSVFKINYVIASKEKCPVLN